MSQYDAVRQLVADIVAAGHTVRTTGQPPPAAPFVAVYEVADTPRYSLDAPPEAISETRVQVEAWANTLQGAHQLADAVQAICHAGGWRRVQSLSTQYDEAAGFYRAVRDYRLLRQP